MSTTPSCWEAGPLTSAPLAAGQTHRVRTQDGQAWTAKRHFSSKIHFSSLAARWACESNSATRPVAGILSRWWWTGGWTGRLGREWWLAPDYTSCDRVPLSSIHMPATAIKIGCLLQQGVHLFVSPLTGKNQSLTNGSTFQAESKLGKNVSNCSKKMFCWCWSAGGNAIFVTLKLKTVFIGNYAEGEMKTTPRNLSISSSLSVWELGKVAFHVVKQMKGNNTNTNHQQLMIEIRGSHGKIHTLCHAKLGKSVHLLKVLDNFPFIQFRAKESKTIYVQKSWKGNFYNKKRSIQME